MMPSCFNYVDSREPFVTWVLVSYAALFIILLGFTFTITRSSEYQYILTWLVGVIGCLTGFVSTVYRKQYIFESRNMIEHFDKRIYEIINKIDNNK